MKEEKKLILKKITIQRFSITLDRDEQQEIKAGAAEMVSPTAVPIFCIMPGHGNN